MVRLAGFEPATFCSGVVSKAANSFILRHGWQPKGRLRNAQDTQWVPNGYRSSTPARLPAVNDKPQIGKSQTVRLASSRATMPAERLTTPALPWLPKWLTGTLLGETGILPDPSPTMMKPAQ